MPSNAFPPLFANTVDNRSAPPVVVAYVGACIIVLVSAIRVFLTIRKKQGFLLDDYTFYTAAVRLPCHQEKGRSVEIMLMAPRISL